jgi:hypothetical protein
MEVIVEMNVNFRLLPKRNGGGSGSRIGSVPQTHHYEKDSNG